MQPIQHQRWLRQEAAAAYLGVSESWLEKMRLRGDGPPYSKLGRTIVYDRAKLDAYAESRERSSTSQAA